MKYGGKIMRGAAAAVSIGVAALGFAGTAQAGQVTYERKCGPNGSTIVTIIATNNSVPTLNGAPGVLVENGPGPADDRYHFTTGPGEHTVIWYGPGANPQDGIVEWGRASITVPAHTDCDDETTTMPGQPTTSEAPGTTTLVPSSTINPCLGQNFDQPTGTWGCYPTTTAPPATGIVTTVAVPPSTLPATATSSTVPLGGGAGVLLLVGAALYGIKRYWRVAS